MKGRKLVVIEGGPHGIAWTHTEQINHALMEFLGEATQTFKVAKIKALWHSSQNASHDAVCHWYVSIAD